MGRGLSVAANCHVCFVNFCHSCILAILPSAVTYSPTYTVPSSKIILTDSPTYTDPSLQFLLTDLAAPADVYISFDDPPS